MKKHLKQFITRGLIAAAFGPVVLAIIYSILSAASVISTLTPGEVSLGILSVTLMAFIIGGVSVVYQIESLPLFSATLIHGIALYLDYLIMYLLNNWIPRSFAAIGIFTLIYIVGYAFIWLGIYLSIRKKTTALNQKLHSGKHA